MIVHKGVVLLNHTEYYRAVFTTKLKAILNSKLLSVSRE